MIQVPMMLHVKIYCPHRMSRKSTVVTRKMGLLFKENSSSPRIAGFPPVTGLNSTYRKSKETALLINKPRGCLRGLTGRMPPALSFNGVPCCLESTKSDPFFEPFQMILVNTKHVSWEDGAESWERAERSGCLISAPITSCIISS